jgi:hypothetical protein
MESLALAAILVVLGTLLGAVVSAVALRRPPASPLARAALAPFAIAALFSGARLALLPIGEPTRVAGALAAMVGAGALYRLAKGPSRSA